ncbi:hypothetical protein V500_09177 [Pseudogymnoascus sp. VKM F-4518 (FW-2643)]|nr:hypothetical protein V500_09177 [Pseudogymnoascus sp. VKM F-4518 (FW-2643)]
MANPPPNLADILRTLSALAPQPQQEQQQPASNPSNPYHFSAPIPQPRPHFEVPSRPQPPPAAAAAPTQDASRITDWPTALRCVMRSVASNERVVGEIRKLIQTQHEHETQWCAGRRELAMKIEARKVGQKKLDEVLRAVGGQVTEAPAFDGAEELRTFDGKVYRAQCQMVGEMGGKLQRLGVPFFGTRSELIRDGVVGDAEADAGDFGGSVCIVGFGVYITITGSDDEEQGLTDDDCKCINPTLIRTVYIAEQKSRAMPANAARGIKNSGKS